MRTFTFNGLDSRNYIDFIGSIGRVYLPPISVPSIKIPNRAGSLSVKRNEIGTQDFEIKFYLYADTQAALRLKARNLVNFLIYEDDKELIFSDETDKKYFARFNQTSTDLEEVAMTGEGTLIFTAFDPFAYSITEAAFTIATKDSTQNNTGTLNVFPKFRIQPSATCDFIKITNVTTNKFIYYNGSLTAGTALIIDHGTNRVYLESTGANRMNNIALESEFFALEKGLNSIRIENQNADSAGLIGNTKISWRKRYY